MVGVDFGAPCGQKENIFQLFSLFSLWKKNSALSIILTLFPPCDAEVAVLRLFLKSKVMKSLRVMAAAVTMAVMVFMAVVVVMVVAVAVMVVAATVTMVMAVMAVVVHAAAAG